VVSVTLTDVLEEASVQFERSPHTHTTTAVSEAQALGIPSAAVAKTVIVKTPDGNVRAVLSALDRIDHRLTGPAPLDFTEGEAMVESYDVLSRTWRTVAAYHRTPPCAVGSPASFKSSAI
jgi:hypothetical protein